MTQRKSQVKAHRDSLRRATADGIKNKNVMNNLSDLKKLDVEIGRLKSGLINVKYDMEHLGENSILKNKYNSINERLQKAEFDYADMESRENVDVVAARVKTEVTDAV